MAEPLTAAGPDEQGRGGGHTWTDEEVGRKAVGLAGLPPAWCPRFMVVTTAAYRRWLPTRDDARWLFDEAGLRTLIDRVCGATGPADRLLVRSSAPGEAIDDRGRFESAACANRDDDIVATVARLWAAARPGPTGHALIIQRLLPAVGRGHLSNERRVSRDARSWVCEREEGEGLPACWRLRAAGPTAAALGPLACPDRPTLRRQLSAVAGVGGQSWGRVHYEWVWDGDRLWVVQQDREEPREGLPPGAFDRQSGQQAIDDFGVLLRADRSLGQWHKTECLRVFAACRLPPSVLYVAEGDRLIRGLAGGQPDPGLVADLRRLGAAPIVVRTDVARDTAHDKTLLPRTDCLDPDRALAFMAEAARDLTAAGLAPTQFCFLLHNYITARAAALSRAAPGPGPVRIDATWGNADGLCYYPHDTFEVTVGSRPRVRPQLRCKERFLDCGPDGKWADRAAGVPWDWLPSLSDPEAVEIARHAKAVAEHVGHAVEVMHFVGVGTSAGGSVCLPWYFASESKNMDDPTAGLDRASIFSKDVITLRDRADLESEGARAEAAPPPRGCTVRLVPTRDLLRDTPFLEAVGRFAVRHHLPVRLEGSALAHVFYILRRQGVNLKVPLPPHRRARRSRFNKLVRDRIPDIIRGNGEAAQVARVRLERHPDLIKAKLVEEALELFWEQEPKGLQRELADLLEVMRAICRVVGIGYEQVVAEADRRREERGGFEDGVILLGTDPVARRTPAGRTLFGPPDDAGADLPAPGGTPYTHQPDRPRGTRSGAAVPLVPPRSDRPRREYRVQSADGAFAVMVVYGDRTVFVRPVPPDPPRGSTQPGLFDTVGEAGR